MLDEQNVQSQGTTQDAAPAAAATMTPVQNDVVRLKAAIAALEETGKELFQDEIAALKQKLVGLEEKAKVEAAAAVAEAVQAEQTFLQKYGQAAVHTIEIALLAAILGKLFGVI
jgi:hypothetical protein